MDNAARALIMAASVIMGVLLFSTLMYVFRAGASLDESYDAAQIVRQQKLFNAKLMEYNRNDNTIMDMITLANKVYNINVDCNYDPAIAIKLIIQIGGQYFVIPDEEPTTRLTRNQIFKSDPNGNPIPGTTESPNPISIYDLIDNDLNNLGITSIDGESIVSTEKLSLTKLGKQSIKNEDGTEKKDAEGNKIYRNNVTIYKYVFTPMEEDGTISYTYNQATSRVKAMKFNAKINSEDWNNIE